ncbi:udp-n-acetylenolpyruvoylglucosamine reductase [Leptolyngbya sp. Heron Island J]|uniref:UDP-N-acetylmuramate dehydrogenase n=1 Tax=Leptolyngbya sp. Heron Island J TaxID=1385935 RepID=UPI0003B98AF7|nr:UDP-N-acetylmuramate dehydrogenase [Leptolyngbya sp. Heron Island J]ESA38753.1 udp-n-acetylenolpyruvoylglucosamine reductase [Leptolyngbya sp. Heron Island J]
MRIPSFVKENVLLAPHTSWNVGGPARWLAEPTINEVRELVLWASNYSIPTYFMGRGSNVLVNDSGLNGLVILTSKSMTELRREGDIVVADSGVSLPKLSQFAAREGFKGFEFLIGIPGTVGGAIVMNAGLTVFKPREMTSIVKDFDVLNPDGNIETLTMADVKAGYRYTDLLNRQSLVLRARFRLEEEEEPSKIRRVTLEHLNERKRKQPLKLPTAGSTFKSPPGNKSAGWYIEQAKLKGTQIGDVRVSLLHANWIENLGKGSSEDVCKLIDYIQKTVESRMGVELEPEICYLD